VKPKAPIIGFCGYIDGCINSPSLDISFTGKDDPFRATEVLKAPKRRL